MTKQWEIFWGSKITADGDWNHETKRHLLLGRKVMTNLDDILKSRDITLPTKSHLVKAMVFPVVMYRCETWTIKKAECQRIDAFKLWCWRRLLRVPWTARRSNESILKEIGPEYSLEGLMLNLKLQYVGHLMQRTDSLEKILMMGKIEGRRRRGQQMMRWLDGITEWTWVWINSRSWWWTGRPVVLLSTGSKRFGHDWVTELKWPDFFTSYSVGGMCNFLGSVLPQQKSVVTDRSSVTAQFYWQAKENISSRCESRQPKRWEEKRNPQLKFSSSFYMFFSPPSEPALCKLG